MRKQSNDVRRMETTGSMMTSEFITIQKESTIEDAITYLRENIKNKTNIHYLYVVDFYNKLVGVLSFRELLSARGDRLVNDVMNQNPISFTAEIDQEEAAKVFRDKDLVSIPVINEQQRILGAVHVESILDVMEQEATEDIYKTASVLATTPEYKGGLLNASIALIYRKRIVWLLILVFMNVFSGAGIAHYEGVIESNVALVFFLPLLIDSGGNAGAQSSTLIIRAMATGDVQTKDWFKMFTKEITLAALIGFTMALAVSTLGLVRGGLDIAIIVSLSMTLLVIVGSLIGMSLPFILKKLNLDPATASAPLITSICDIIGVLIYFGIAAWFLGF